MLCTVAVCVVGAGVCVRFLQRSCEWPMKTEPFLLVSVNTCCCGAAVAKLGLLSL
jgi:hypothetical protein